MKGNKGLLTILANLADFILQARIKPSETFMEHLDMLQTQLSLLRSQSLPSTEIIHSLVQQYPYKMKSKINEFLQTSTLDQLALTITFTLTDKRTLKMHVVEVWRFKVFWVKERKVLRESRAHQLLNLITKVFQRLSAQQFFNEMVRNRETQKQYIIDFDIKMKQQSKQSFTLNELGKLTFNCTSFDNSHQIQTEFYTNTKLHIPATIPENQITHRKNIGKVQSVKNSLEITRGTSFNQQQHTIKRKFNSQFSIFQRKDSELDLTILSYHSDLLSPKQILAAQENQMQQFELLAEEKGKDERFLEDNRMMFNIWQRRLQQNFA